MLEITTAAANKHLLVQSISYTI